jgi:hypothetical protein
VKYITVSISVVIAVFVFLQPVSAAPPYKINPGYQNLSKNVKAGRKPAESALQTSADPADQRVGPLSSKWKREIIDTTAGADYLTKIEKDVIIELNMMRTDPASYARHYLEPLKSLYQGKLLKYPGEIPVSTSEGITALDECIKVLSNAKPLRPLFPKKGLIHAAREHAKDQGETGATGHTGSNGSTIISRVNRYGRWNISVGENIDYGNNDAGRIVAALLIDDGIPSRGHRKNMLDAAFGFVGVAVGSHKEYGHMCVMDFAGAYD